VSDPLDTAFDVRTPEVTLVDVLVRPGFIDFCNRLRVAAEHEGKKSGRGQQRSLVELLTTLSMSAEGDGTTQITMQALPTLSAKALGAMGYCSLPKDVLIATAQERVRQIQKFGEQDRHPAHIWAAILGEEIGESFRAYLDRENLRGSADHDAYKAADAHLREELIQVIAVCAKWWEASHP